MSGEIIAIVAVGVALGGLILTSSRGLRQDMTRMESWLDGHTYTNGSATPRRSVGLSSSSPREIGREATIQ